RSVVVSGSASRATSAGAKAGDATLRMRTAPTSSATRMTAAHTSAPPRHAHASATRPAASSPATGGECHAGASSPARPPTSTTPSPARTPTRRPPSGAGPGRVSGLRELLLDLRRERQRDARHGRDLVRARLADAPEAPEPAEKCAATARPD